MLGICDAKAVSCKVPHVACHAGRASKQLLEVRCHSVQGQRVHGQQEGPISAAFFQLYSGNGIMLLMVTWATLTSNHEAEGRSGGYVISVLMDTRTAGKHVCLTGPEAVAVLSAAATKCASTTAWLPRLLR